MKIYEHVDFMTYSNHIFTYFLAFAGMHIYLLFPKWFCFVCTTEVPVTLQATKKHRKPNFRFCGLGGIFIFGWLVGVFLIKKHNLVFVLAVICYHIGDPITCYARLFLCSIGPIHVMHNRSCKIAMIKNK